MSRSTGDWFSRLIHGFTGLFDGTEDDDDDPSRTHISYLPDELMISIFSFLEMSDLVTCRRVCSRWRRVAADARLWRGLDLEYEPGTYSPKRRRMLKLAPCVHKLTLLLPTGRHRAFQSRELQLVPPVVRHLHVDFVPSTLVLVIQVLEKVLPLLRRLELFAQDEVTYFPAGDRFPLAEVRRLWTLLAASRLDSLALRGWCGELLEKWNLSGLASPGPCSPQLQQLEVDVMPKLVNKVPTRREEREQEASHHVSHTIAMLLRCHASTLRTVSIDVKYEEPHNDLIAAPLLCPHLVDLSLRTNVFRLKSLRSPKEPECGSLDVEGCGWDRDLTASFLRLSFVRTRVQALTLTHIDHNIMYVWPALTQWDRLRFLDIRKCSCLELQVPLARLVAQLPCLERLRFWKVRHFKDGSRHLGELSPAVAPNMRELIVHLACCKECVCDAQSRLLRNFTGLTCSFVCNFR